MTYNVDVESADSTVEYNQGVDVVSDRGSDDGMDEDSVLHPTDKGWGTVEVDESGGLKTIYPTGTPSSPGEKVVENSLMTCIELAKAYDGIIHVNEGESKSTAVAREFIFRCALLKLIFLADYAIMDDHWDKLLLIIASNMNYTAGLRIFRFLSQEFRPEMKQDPEHHYNKAVARLWKRTSADTLRRDKRSEDDGKYEDFLRDRTKRLIPAPPKTRVATQKRKRSEGRSSSASSDKPLNLPRKVYRIQSEPLFTMTKEDEETSEWLLKKLIKGFGLKRYVYSEYITRLLETNKIFTSMHNKGSGRYDLFKYNETTGTMMRNEPSTLLLDLEMVAIKTCFKFESWAEGISPFNLCYEILVQLNQLEHRFDFSALDTYLLSAACRHSLKLTSNRHLVFSNGRTYDLYGARYVPWNPDQVCTVRSECDLTLGVGEKVDHYYVEVHPTRGGFRYRCQLLCKTIEEAWSVFKNHKLGHEVFAVIKAMADRVVKKMSTFSDPEEFMDNFLEEMCSESPTKFQEYFDVKPKYEDTQINLDDVPTQADMNEIMHNAESKLECISKHGTSSKSSLYCCVVIYIVSLRFLLKKHPDLRNAVMDTALKPSAHDDDGGPISFVRSQLTWDQLVWTMLIELFGSSEQARMVLEFLALGLSTDYSGKCVMFMHGEAANGKSLFLGILRHVFGKTRELVRTLHSNSFTSKSKNRMAAPLRHKPEEIRFVIQRKIPILDIDEDGRRMLTQFTGGDRVSIPQQYDRCHTEFRLSAKFLMSSNDIPYFSRTMTVEQSRFMIVPTVSTFLADKSCLRKQLLKHLSADRYCTLLFSTPYPVFEDGYIQKINKQANTIFTQSCSSLGARNMLFPEHHLNILEDSFATELRSAPRSIPTQRWLLGNPNLMFDEAQEKLGAALCRILLDHIVPSMGGLENVTHTVGKLESYVSQNASTFDSYKNVLYIILKRLIVRRKGFSIPVKKLRKIVAQELTKAKRALRPILFGRYKGAGSEAFGYVEDACKTKDAFCRILREWNFNLSSANDGMHLNDFQSLDEFLEDRERLDVSPIEALVMRDDLKKYEPDNMFNGPTDDEVDRIRAACLRPPIVRSDFVNGTDAGDTVNRRLRVSDMILRANQYMAIHGSS